VQELIHSPLVSRKRRLDFERASIFWCASSSGIGMGSSVLSGELWKSKRTLGRGFGESGLNEHVKDFGKVRSSTG